MAPAAPAGCERTRLGDVVDVLSVWGGLSAAGRRPCCIPVYSSANSPPRMLSLPPSHGMGSVRGCRGRGPPFCHPRRSSVGGYPVQLRWRGDAANRLGMGFFMSARCCEINCRVWISAWLRPTRTLPLQVSLGVAVGPAVGLSSLRVVEAKAQRAPLGDCLLGACRLSMMEPGPM